MEMEAIQSIVEVICSLLTASGIVYGIRSQARENHYRSISMKISRFSTEYSSLPEFHLLLKSIDNSNILKDDRELLVDELFDKTIKEGKSLYFDNQIHITEYCTENQEFASLCNKYKTFQKYKQFLN